MEGKVDIEKLQILNDRINQTIDALNQVRMSVHGLTQTPGLGQGAGLSHSAAGQVPGQGVWGGGVSPYALQQLYSQYAGAGLQHSPMMGGQVPFQGGFGSPVSQFGGGQIPAQAPQFAQGVSQAPQFGQVGIGQGHPLAGGLGHTSIDPARISQTFPNAFMPW